MAAKHAALETWWHTYDDADRARARALLERMGCGHLADRPISTASDGERQRVQLARTLMVDPDLLLLDEPTAGLDLGGREALVARLADLAADPQRPGHRARHPPHRGDPARASPTPSSSGPAGCWPPARSTTPSPPPPCRPASTPP